MVFQHLLLTSYSVPTRLLPIVRSLLQLNTLLSISTSLLLPETMIAGNKGIGLFLALKSLPMVFIGDTELIYAFLKLFLDGCFSHEFFVKLQIEFNIKRGSFGA